ncbi:MAG TPA: hypothetical protein VM510_06480 [Caulifigura sp.]|jgi:hypothetical protein|nr:hypothetical protein [Caulifigura sp.]
MAQLRSLLRRKTSLLVELALLAPVAGLVTLGGLEIRRMCAVEAALADAASQIAMSGFHSPDVSRNRRELSRTLGIGDHDIVVSEEDGLRVTVSVPYAKAGSMLAFLWSNARMSGTAERAG